MMKKRNRLLLLAASVALLASGCANSNDAADAPKDTDEIAAEADNTAADTDAADEEADTDADAEGDADLADEDLNAETDSETAEEPWYKGATSSGGFAFCANGGEMTFFTKDSEEFTSSFYTYWMDDDQALNDIMGTESGDALISIEKEGAEFDGWTLYEAESLFSSYEPITDEADGIEWFTYSEEEEFGTYVLLRNPVVYGEQLPTEQLCGITCEGKNYYAIANWK